MKTRIPETDQGIQGDVSVAAYDVMQRNLRDKGWIETMAVIDSGITIGHSLEIGHGPGYLGLEWLKKTEHTTLTGVDISPDMNALAKQNASQYGMSDRVDYQIGNSDKLPFADNKFDAVFTNGSLHEWQNPISAFNEIWRVVKPGGIYFISDLRRDINFLMNAFLWLSTKPASIRPGLKTSIQAAYTPHELLEMVHKSKIIDAVVKGNPIGVKIFGKK